MKSLLRITNLVLIIIIIVGQYINKKFKSI
jgi:hypothetical protein